MSYIGAEPTTAAFPFDQFSGNGTTTAFTLTYAPASATSIIVAISGVVQNPNTYSIVSNTLTFSPAPPTGTNNIAVLYLGLPVQIGTPIPGSRLELALGSAANPSLTFLGDTNTGIFSPAADTIAFAEGGTEVMRISSNAVITSSLGGMQVISGTAVTASGTSVDFTGIPSWAKRITVMFNGVSVSSTNPARVQIGTSSGVEATGYLGASSTIGSTTVATSNFTDGFAIRGLTGTDVFSGTICLTNINGNIWVANGFLAVNSATATAATGGTKTTSGTLDRVRITINGTDTFDAGTINLLWE